MKKILSFIILALTLSIAANAQGGKKFTFEDVMKFRAIQHETIADDGEWAGYSAVPDRGNPYTIIVNTYDTSQNYKVERAVNPSITHNSEWAAMTLKPDAIEMENAEKDKPKDGMAILNISSGTVTQIENVDKFEFSNDAKWLVYRPFEEDDKEKDTENKKKTGSDLKLRHLATGTEILVSDVTEYHIDSTSTYIFYARSEKEGKNDGIYYRELQKEYCPEGVIDTTKSHYYSNIAWNLRDSVLAYLSADLQDNGEPMDCALRFWDENEQKVDTIMAVRYTPEGWFIPHYNKLKWTEDGGRLFFGTKPVSQKYDPDEDKIKFSEDNFYDIDTILQQAEVDLWHWKDPRIKTNAKKRWKQKKEKTYQAVYHLKEGKFVQLADTNLPNVHFVENPDHAVGYNDKPYLKEITWSGWFQDIYVVDMKDGSKKLIDKRNMESAHISPLGKFVLYFKDKSWQLYDIEQDTTVDLTTRVDVPFVNKEREIPQGPYSYGVGGWQEDDLGVYIYDKYDVWLFRTDEGYGYMNITVGDGRVHKIKFRIQKMDPDKRWYNERDTVYLRGFHKKMKWQKIYRHETWVLGVETIIKKELRHQLVAKAKDAPRFLFTRESYNQFPDLWSSNSTFITQRKLSDLNKQIDGFNWGNTELVEWENSEGDTLQGFIIKPDNFDSTKRYPTLIYFYEKFSDRYHQFTMPRVNHRPCYPLYVSDGYVLFLPDIKYDEGKPGLDATDALVTGSQKLIDMGIADPDKIGIQGHSWGGYETAFIITETDMFAAACAGAPVSNMTSAYGGIRLGSGLARQFQYEQYQSRIGGNLWDSLDNYMRNSPLFHVPKIKTPLLMMFGDKDEAVPWQQGIELYLGMRRLGKEVFFLQYRDEPHHPRKMPNKLDYATRMKDFYDHYLKGEPVKEWMEEEIPYRGK